MSYIITAEVDTSSEEHYHGRVEDVDARILREEDNRVTFDIPGDFQKQEELTRKLCNSLIDAGFISFTIHHSY